MEKQEQGTAEMQGIVSRLKQSKVFSNIEVLEFIDEDSVQLLKVKAFVKDGSILHITELQTPDYQKYAYHWQKENGEMLVRWDNSPHYKKLKTFPHHRHEGNNTLPSHRITLDEIIDKIRNIVEK